MIYKDKDKSEIFFRYRNRILQKIEVITEIIRTTKGTPRVAKPISIETSETGNSGTENIGEVRLME